MNTPNKVAVPVPAKIEPTKDAKDTRDDHKDAPRAEVRPGVKAEQPRTETRPMAPSRQVEGKYVAPKHYDASQLPGFDPHNPVYDIIVTDEAAAQAAENKAADAEAAAKHAEAEAHKVKVEAEAAAQVAADKAKAADEAAKQATTSAARAEASAKADARADAKKAEART